MIRNAKRMAACFLLAGLLAAGAAVPTAGAASVLVGPALSVQWPWQKPVPVESIELGSYKSTMTVGETQQLTPVVLPSDATNPILTFVSEDSNIVVVGDNGMIGAVAEGTTRVAATADGVTSYYQITVLPDPATVVTDMDLTLSPSTLSVGETANLSIAVSPSSAASTAQVTFSSSNSKVATVNNFGKVTAVGKGKATITAQCGDVVRSVEVTVSVSTDGIHLNTNYVVLKPGASFTITGSVTPSSAPQGLSFRSNDRSVATVSSGGVITAVGTGSTSIVVTNGDSSSMVTVIVNQSSSSSGTTDDPNGSSESSPEDQQTEADPILQQISQAEGSLTLAQSDVPVLTKAYLDALRSSGKTLTLTGSGYQLTIHGSQIKNTSNELDTLLVFTPAEKGLEFVLNNGSALPAAVEIHLEGENAGYSRLYLLNSASDQWQYLDNLKNGVITADTAGSYLLTNETLTFIGMNLYALIAAGVVLLAIVVVYIVVKKRYWFW